MDSYIYLMDRYENNYFDSETANENANLCKNTILHGCINLLTGYEKNVSITGVQFDISPTQKISQSKWPFPSVLSERNAQVKILFKY